MKIRLLPNHIHIWQISLNSTNDLIKNYSLLSPEEKERADRFVFERHRRRFIIAHAALRHILSNYLSIPPQAIEFNVLLHGKPQIIAEQNPQQLEFNLSHSGEMALVGLRWKIPLGVDVEYYRDREFLGIAEHVFSDKECLQLAMMEEEDKIQSFFHIWAQKEAFIKAIGQGLSYPLKDFTVSASPPAHLQEAKHEVSADWYLHSFKPEVNAQAAIATLKPVIGITYFDFTSLSKQFRNVTF